MNSRRGCKALKRPGLKAVKPSGLLKKSDGGYTEFEDMSYLPSMHISQADHVQWELIQPGSDGRLLYKGLPIGLGSSVGSGLIFKSYLSHTNLQILQGNAQKARWCESMETMYSLMVIRSTHVSWTETQPRGVHKKLVILLRLACLTITSAFIT